VGTEEAFRAGIESGFAPGGQLCVRKGNVTLLDRAHGDAQPDLAFDLASLTKVLSTVYLVAKARQYGLCELDDPLDRFVPAAAAGVTLRHALEHSSGYPAHRHFYDDLPEPAGSREAYEFCVRAAARTPLEAEPGTRIKYSDLGFILLGAAMERLFAEPLAALVRKDTHGAFFPSNEDRASLQFASTAHLGLSEDRPPVTLAPGVVHDGNCRAMGGAAGHAGLFGSARQVTALAARWLAAARGEDDAWLRPAFVAETFAPSRIPGRATGWDRAMLGGHTGDVWPADTIGHLGFTGTSMWMSPSKRLICTLVINRGCTVAQLKEYRRTVYRAAWEEFS